MCVCVHIYTCVYVYGCLGSSKYMYIYVYICIYLHIYLHLWMSSSLDFIRPKFPQMLLSHEQFIVTTDWAPGANEPYTLRIMSNSNVSNTVVK